MKQSSADPSELLLRHEESDVGLIRGIEHRKGKIWSGRIQLTESVKSRVGWQARRFADALDAMATYLQVLGEEGEKTRSCRFKAAVARLEQGEIGHYLFVTKGWHAVDEARTSRGLKLLNYFRDGMLVWQWQPSPKRQCSPTMIQPSFAPISSLLSHRLIIREGGRHPVGGPPRHLGVLPLGSQVPLHHLLTIDLADLRSPLFYRAGGIRYLPLYYPLAYGSGGARVQYLVRSDDRIEIVFMSDSEPDAPPRCSILVPELPVTGAEFVELTYEELRVRKIRELEMRAIRGRPDLPDGMSPADDKLCDDLEGNTSVLLGGTLDENAGTQVCRNPACDKFETNIELVVLACVPPIRINGSTAFWDDYESDSLRFYFGLCPCCRSVIASNFCD